MNRVLLTGRLTRDPELRSLASGKTVTQFSLATNEYRGGQEKSEFHTVVTWDRLAEICAQYLGKGQLVAIEGRLQTRQWEDERKLRHWKTEIVAGSVEMLSGRRKKDYAAESAAEALAAQAGQLGVEPHELAGDDARRRTRRRRGLRRRDRAGERGLSTAAEARFPPPGGRGLPLPRPPVFDAARSGFGSDRPSTCSKALASRGVWIVAPTTVGPVGVLQ